MCPESRPSPGDTTPTVPQPTPAWLVAEVVSHARTQLQKGWTPLDVSSNLQKRFGLLEVSATTVVAELLARRQGRGANESTLLSTFQRALEIGPEQGAVIAQRVLSTGLALDDDTAAFALVFEPSRAPVAEAAQEGDHPTEGAAPSRHRPRVSGPFRMRINLLRGE